MIIGADIGGHHIAAALVDGATDAVVDGSYRHRATDRKASAEALIAEWAAVIDELADLAGGRVDGVGVAMPGPFDYAAGVAHFEGNDKFEGLNGVNVRDALRERTRAPHDIRFLNDATAFAVGCCRMGDAPRTGRAVALTLGTGLGAAFVEDGVPVIAGEGAPPDGSLWHLPFKAGIADDYVSVRWILDQAREVLGPTAEGVAELATRARRDPAIAAIFEAYGENLGAIAAPWLVSFGADGVVLGGRITGAFDLFAPSLERILESAGAVVSIRTHPNTEDAAIVGAAATFDAAFWSRARTRLPRR